MNRQMHYFIKPLFLVSSKLISKKLVSRIYFGIGLFSPHCFFIGKMASADMVPFSYLCYSYILKLLGIGTDIIKLTFSTLFQDCCILI